MSKAFCFAVCLALPALAEMAALSLEMACLEADLVVVGTLRLEATEGSKRTGYVLRLKTEEILFGRVPGNGIQLEGLYSEEGKPLIEKACIPDPAAFRDQKRIWVLYSGKDGTFQARHPVLIQPLEKRAEVEKGLQARLAPSLKVLSEAPRFRVEMGEETKVPAEIKAYEALVAAGPAGVEAARTLLRHARPEARAAGCRLAGMLKDPVLTKVLKALEEDAGKVVSDYGCYTEETTVGKAALEALSRIEAARPPSSP